ncbi:YraN family protein [Flavisolibacter nicotianae]|uniref:YraN family protein n=1 Tax=Flavisolibacter nicotianae TaxID=2364882 RepID=UPI000EAE75A3|nr:YraN family protein [Flavisolibacter nicotianae]
MASHLDIGKEGEKLAEQYLSEKGYQLLHRNWRYGRYELDLVTLKNEKLRFVEVKFRSCNQYGNPEEAVTKKKIKSLLQAIDQFLFLHPQYDDFRLDVISITQIAPGRVEYFLIEDVTL